MDVLSPELVLVDPVLAVEARLLLGAPQDCLARRRREPAPVEGWRHDNDGVSPRRIWASGGSCATPIRSGSPNDPAGAPLFTVPSFAPERRLSSAFAPSVVVEDHRRVRPSLLTIVVMLLLALLIGLPSFDLVPWSSAERPSFVPADPNTEATTAPAEGLVLAWPKAEGATLYDLVLWRGGRRMLDLWPETNHIDVHDTVAKSGKRLPPGTYRWFVFAGFGSRDDLRFRKALANGAFTIE